MIDTRQHVHDLIDRPPPAQLTAVAGLLESMLDPVSHTLAMAPLEDEEIGEEERRTVARSRSGLSTTRALPLRKSSPKWASPWDRSVITRSRIEAPRLLRRCGRWWSSHLTSELGAVSVRKADGL
jgi:hypothetical protein